MNMKELEQAMLSATDKAEQVLLFTELMKAKSAIERETLEAIYNKEMN